MDSLIIESLQRLLLCKGNFVAFIRVCVKEMNINILYNNFFGATFVVRGGGDMIGVTDFLCFLT